MSLSFTLREITKDDQGFLFEMLYQSIYMAPGSPSPPREIVQEPALSKYVEDWGRPGDKGCIALDAGGSPCGAVWLRCFSEENRGYGFVSESIPELGIAVSEHVRGLGLGTLLLESVLKQNEGAVSLSVQLANPALRLYERLGFTPFRKTGESMTMIRKSDV